MLVVGLTSIVYWKVKRRISLKYFLWGGLIWVIAITPKIIMNYTITSTINKWATATLGLIGMLFITGVYVGLRTGILECGFTYLVFSKTKLKNVSLNEAVAFGIGFGGFEAILVALPSLLQFIVFILNPSLIQLLPEEARKAVEVQLNMPTWIILAPIMERVFTILVHLFATLMIYCSIRENSLKPFVGAILYKTLLDALLPYLQWTFKPTTSPIGIYQVEVWPTLMGIIAVIGIRYYFKNVYRES